MTVTNKKHLAFIDEYFLQGMHGTNAYMTAYPKASYDTARANAAKLLADTSISAEINRRLDEKKMSADEVLTRLADMARADIADFADVKKITDLKKDEYRGRTHVIKKLKSKLTTDALGRQIEEVEIELYPADTNLERIGKVHGLFSNDPGSSEDKPFVAKIIKEIVVNHNEPVDNPE